MVYHGARYIDPARQQFRPEQLAITVEKKGSHRFTKASHPTRFGKYAEIRTRDHEFHFNLNGQIQSLDAKINKILTWAILLVILLIFNGGVIVWQMSRPLYQ